MTVRPAAWAAVVVPAALSAALFTIAATSPAKSGAGLSEDDRPIGFLMLSAFAAAGWIIGTAAMFLVVRPSHRLPRPARLLAANVVYGPRAVAAVVSNPEVADAAGTLSTLHLLVLALITVPLLTFLAPMLLGWLFQPSVYRPVEFLAVLLMGVVIVIWTAWLLRRATT